MVVYFKGKGAPWVTPLMYGLGASALVFAMLVGLVSLSSLSYFSRRVKPQVTSDNVETKIKDWLYTFGASINKLSTSEAPDTIFAMRARPKGSGIPITIQRPRDIPHYVVIQAAITLGPEEKTLRAMLSKRQIQELDLELQAEMARAKIGYQPLKPSASLLDGLLVERRIPITDDLTEDAFMQRFEEVQYDIAVANSTMILGLRRKVHETQPSN